MSFTFAPDPKTRLNDFTKHSLPNLPSEMPTLHLESYVQGFETYLVHYVNYSDDVQREAQ